MKNNIRNLFILISAITLFSSGKVNAQYDGMFTNYMWNEMFINPGYAGSREAISAVGLLRDQWVGIDGAPMTQTLTVHGPFLDNQAGLGASVMHESIGITKQTYFMGTFAYRFRLGPGKLSMGLSIGMLSKRDMYTKVITDQPSDINFTTNTPLMTMPNGSFGLYYYTDKMYVGLSVPRLINNKIAPDVGTWEAKNTFEYQNLHYYLAAGYIISIMPSLRLRPTVMLKTVYAAPVEADVSVSALIRDSFWAGLAYRTGDAASLLLGYQITPNLRVGYSYDYSISRLQKLNNGSHEICIGYDFSPGKSKIVSPRVF